jgi:signal recognition particle subunit SRP54
MFEALTTRLTEVFNSLRGRGKISEANVREVMRNVRTALIEADVNFEVARKFCDDVVAKAVGQKVTQSLQPDQLMVKIVFDELTALMGPVDPNIPFISGQPTVLMLCGLQGAGKTTTAGKLARLIRDDRKRKPLMAAADLQRPAAVEQLKVIGQQLGIPVYSEDGGKDPVAVCRNAVKEAVKQGCDTVILDTAGRLAIDEPLMAELKNVAGAVQPQQIYLVIDAMIGQDAVNTAKAFNERLELDGVILTKLDGDARGGAALTVKAVTGKPIKFCGVGEKLDKLEPFNPEQMAVRILGKPDLLALFRTAQTAIDQDKARQLQEEMAKGQFTLDMFVEQLQQVKKMGSITDIMKMMGMGSMFAGMDMDDRELDRTIAIVRSMTPKERRNPDVIEAGRRRRIAKGSGTNPEDVGMLVKNFNMVKPMMLRMSQMSLFGRMKAINELTKIDWTRVKPGDISVKKPANDDNEQRRKMKEKLKRRKR